MQAGVVNREATGDFGWASRGVRSALAIGVGCYAGTLIASHLRFPFVSIAVISPAPVILLVALLLTPTRTWWVWLLAAATAVLVAESQVGVPAATGVAHAVGNGVEAVLAARGLRRFGDRAYRFDSLRGVALFIATAVIVAPTISSLVVVALMVPPPPSAQYWFLWGARSLADAFSNLTLAPLLLLPRVGGMAALRDVVRRRWAEFALVVLGLLVLGIPAFGAKVAGPQSYPALLYAPLPLLLWAAVRFGIRGLCVTLLVVAVLSLSSAVAGRGPFITDSPGANALSLQMFLLALGLPLMSLAALVRERERTDRAMRESQKRYRLATTAGGVGVWDWNLRTNEIYVDPALKAILGYEDHEIANGVAAWGRHVHPDDAARVTSEARLHLENAAHPYEVEHRMLHKDGTVRWFLARGAAVERDGGEAVRIIGTDTDITERKRAETALGESEALHRITLGNISDAVFLTDERGAFTFICPNVDVIFGYGLQEVHAMGCISRLLGDGLPDFRALTAAGEMRNLEHDIATKSGGRRTLLVHLKRVAIKGATVLYVCRDITERKRAEEELLRSEARYRAIVEDQTELICRYLTDGTITFVNDAYCRYFATTRDALLGYSFWHFIPEKEREQCRRFIASITREHAVGMIEHRVLRPNGEVAWMQWTDRGLFASDGRLVELQSVGRDITERKRADEEHRLLEAQRQVEEALREGDRRKDAFLAMLAHELRNPLAPVGLALEVMRKSPLSDERMRWAQDVIARQVRQMTRLVDDLLDVSRITRGKIRLQLEPVDMRTVVAEAIETSRPLVDGRRHELSVSLPEEAVRVRGDAVRLTQIVANLLNNAARYTEPGGHIRLSLTGDSREALLSVCDNGIGLAPEMLSRVFDPFVQGESTHGGLGIGLTLVKQLVEMQGGAVEGRSPGRGQGSEFVIRLPSLADEPAGTRRAATEGVALQHCPLRILVVDDNVDAAESLARLLELWQHTVRVTHDGPDALDAMTVFAPDVLLLDLGLPTMDGLEVARRVRQMPDGATLLLVAMTGFGQDQDRYRTRAAGFDDHLVKPIDIETLRSLLARCRRDVPT